MKTYNQIRYGEYAESERAVTIRSSFGDCGGGGEVLVVDTLVFDEGQITCPTNGLHPKWGGAVTRSPGMQEGR